MTGKAQLNACAFSDGVKKQKCCLGPGDTKTVITFLLCYFFLLKLGMMFCNSSGNCSCDFYIFPIVGIGAINFQSKKTTNPLVLGCFFSAKEVEKLFEFNFHKLHNMTNVFVQNLCFYCAWFSIQSLFKTTPCPLKR